MGAQEYVWNVGLIKTRAGVKPRPHQQEDKAMIKEYLTYIETVRGLSANTIEGYRKDLREFVRYAADRGLRWSTLQERDVDGWLSEQAQAGISPRTRNRRLSALRGLLNWAHHKGMLTQNAARFCQQAKKPDSLPKPTDLSAIDRYLGERQPGTAANIAALQIALMVESGLRISEAIMLTMEDIDTTRKSIRVRGKGNKDRYTFYGARVERELMPLMGGKGRLFPAWSTQFYRSNIEDQLRPFTGAITPHQLRHTFATSQLNAGMPISTLSMMLGHKSVETTQVYTRVAVDTARSQYQSINN